VRKRDLSVSHNKIGDVLRLIGEFSDALKSFEASISIRDRLAETEPANATLQIDLALSVRVLGRFMQHWEVRLKRCAASKRFAPH
jgi:hypothetical protein